MICSICGIQFNDGSAIKYNNCEKCIAGLYTAKEQIIKQGEIIVKTVMIDEIIDRIIEGDDNRYIIEMLEKLKGN